MQNKPNFRKAKMNVSAVNTKGYENIRLVGRRENKPNSNPIKANKKPIKANKMPKQPQYKANQTQFQRQKNAKTKPKQTQSNPISKAKKCQIQDNTLEAATQPNDKVEIDRLEEFR